MLRIRFIKPHKTTVFLLGKELSEKTISFPVGQIRQVKSIIKSADGMYLCTFKDNSVFTVPQDTIEEMGSKPEYKASSQKGCCK